MAMSHSHYLPRLSKLVRWIAVGVALLALGGLFSPWGNGTGAVNTTRGQSAPTAQIAATPAVLVEAIKQANVRSGPGVDYPSLGMITSGTRYALIGRSARFPWYLIAVPELPAPSEGWVYVDVVTVTGNAKSVPVTEQLFPTPTLILATDGPVQAAASPTLATLPASPSLVQTQGQVNQANQTNNASASPSLTPTTAATVPVDTVTVEALDTTNVRYGPGTDFPRIGSISKGQLYPVLRRHTQFPWLEIAFSGTASGRGWVYRPTVKINGDLNKVPITTARSFDYPTLTPTLPMIVTSAPPFTATVGPATNDTVDRLGGELYDYLLKSKYEPNTDTEGSIFLLDLQTGRALSLNPGIAYSGMSLAKIPLLVSLYRKIDALPNKMQANLIAEMMICSENLASNALLKLIGDGDPELGAQYVTDTMHKLGLNSILLLRSFWTGAKDVTPTAPPAPVATVQTPANQTSAEPDPYNQATPEDLGWLLSAMVQCAVDGSGPLNAAFPNAFTVNECRQMIGIMRADKIGALVEAGVPTEIKVAHKHGWVNDTHGDAAYVSTPGGDYVLVVMLHNKTWLNYENSFPVIAEISRLTYNAYNPSRLLDKTHTQPVPDCAIPNDALVDLQNPNLPPIR